MNFFATASKNTVQKPASEGNLMINIFGNFYQFLANYTLHDRFLYEIVVFSAKFAFFTGLK
jgi:hypothetical protein